MSYYGHRDPLEFFFAEGFIVSKPSRCINVGTTSWVLAARARIPEVGMGSSHAPNRWLTFVERARKFGHRRMLGFEVNDKLCEDGVIRGKRSQFAKGVTNFS